MSVLLPYLSERSSGLVITSKGRLARYLQLEVGDVLFNTPDEKLWAAEIKAEERWTGNLFLETWSNRNFSDRDSHAERGSNRGWMDHCRADLLLYYFLDADWLYTVDLFRLKQWAFGFGGQDGHIYDYPERAQSKYGQRNETCGRLVPIEDLARALGTGFRRCRVKQLPMWGKEAA